MKVEPILINIPSSESNLTGLVDLSSMMLIDYSADQMGKVVTLEEIDKDHKLFDMAITAREIMIDKLSNYDEELGDLYLSEEIADIKADDIDKAIIQAALS